MRIISMLISTIIEALIFATMIMWTIYLNPGRFTQGQVLILIVSICAAVLITRLIEFVLQNSCINLILPKDIITITISLFIFYISILIVGRFAMMPITISDSFCVCILFAAVHYFGEKFIAFISEIIISAKNRSLREFFTNKRFER